jgi:thiol-disulfide isomerase/thioredoxin
LTSRAFAAYPNEESAREWAQALYAADKREEALSHLAEAFAIPDLRATEATRLDDRLLLGQWYTALHKSEKGLGDVILAAYDRTSTLVETRRKKLLALDPNAAAQNPLEFTLTGLDGQRFRMSSLKGNLIVLDFWATWCAPCRAQHPLYETLKQRFPKEKGVVFLAIDADEDRSVVEPFLEEMMWDKNVYYEDGLARLLNVVNIPTTILFDGEGTMVSRMDGFNPETFLDLMTARIEGLLAAPAAAPAAK